MKNITIGKSAYIPNTPDKILDTMERSNLSISATGDHLVIVTNEAACSFLKSYDEDMLECDKKTCKELYAYLLETIQSIDQVNKDKTPIGDIFFVG